MVWWQFWKRGEESDIAALEKELGLGRDTGLETKPTEESYDRLSQPGEPPVSFEANRYENSRNAPSQQPMQQSDLQLLSAKLDTIKAMLDLINQRISSLERNAEDKQKPKYWQ